jgi:hypothetical protein
VAQREELGLSDAENDGVWYTVGINSDKGFTSEAGETSMNRFQNHVKWKKHQ